MKSPFKTTNQLQLQQEQPAATNKSRMLSFRATRTTSLSLHLNKMRSVKKTSKQREKQEAAAASTSIAERWRPWRTKVSAPPGDGGSHRLHFV